MCTSAPGIVILKQQDGSVIFIVFRLKPLVIEGLPKHVNQTELQNLLKWLPGYEASHMRPSLCCAQRWRINLILSKEVVFYSIVEAFDFKRVLDEINAICNFIPSARG